MSTDFKRLEEKPLLILKKFKELTDLIESMSKEEWECMNAGLEYYALHKKYPKHIPL